MSDDPALPALVLAAREVRHLKRQVWWLALNLVRFNGVWDPMACAVCDHEYGGLPCVRCWAKQAEKETQEEAS